MSTTITMIVPIKNTVPGVSNVFSAPGHQGELLMAKPVNNQPQGGKMEKTNAPTAMTNRQISAKAAPRRVSSAEPADSGSAAKAGGAERLQCRSQRDREAKAADRSADQDVAGRIARIQKEEMEKQQQEQ